MFRVSGSDFAWREGELLIVEGKGFRPPGDLASSLGFTRV